MDTSHNQRTRFTTPLTTFLYLTLLFLQSTTIISGAVIKHRCHPDDQKALLTIKQSFNNSYLFGTWTPTYDCCRDWYMVKCDRTNHRIISLEVAAYPLTGTLPPSIGDLPYLQSLRFHKLTNLTGNIPSTISNLQDLTSIDLTWNQLSGKIPTFFSTMKNLQMLELSFNQFSGHIPPELSLAPNLYTLALDRNLLTGPIPKTFGSFKQSSFGLYLSHNKLSGKIPISLKNMNFTQVDLSRNRLTGDASILFGKSNATVRVVDLSRNRLSFDLSKVVMSPGLEYLDLSHNKVFGKLPATGMENLGFLNVSYNRLCGPIPNVGSLQTFDKTSYFHNKCLCGAPLSFCNSSSTFN